MSSETEAQVRPKRDRTSGFQRSWACAVEGRVSSVDSASLDSESCSKTSFSDSDRDRINFFLGGAGADRSGESA